jgi:hypothetical protein
MTAVRSVAVAAAERSNTFSGQLLEPGNGGYEEARKVHNGLVDKPGTDRAVRSRD